MGVRQPRAAGNIVHFSVPRGKLVDMRVELGQKGTIAPVLYLLHFPMTVGGTLKKSFAGFAHIFLVWWGYERNFEVCCKNLTAAPKIYEARRSMPMTIRLCTTSSLLGGDMRQGVDGKFRTILLYGGDLLASPIFQRGGRRTFPLPSDRPSFC